MEYFLMTFAALVCGVALYEFAATFRKRRWGENP